MKILLLKGSADVQTRPLPGVRLLQRFTFAELYTGVADACNE